ncbi:MAG: hypothetical protein B7X47_07845 [Ferrovum sp. 34-44-207]|nr:MAG: hypothetical protein B7X47_07845 [Ferrovum sp. 34-44-207]
MNELPSPSLKEALRYWHRLGWVSFGGPVAQVAMMHEDLVLERQWVDEEQFRRALTLCTILPGPEAQQLATYLGWALNGSVGGLCAGLLFILPSIFILIILAYLLVNFGQISFISHFLFGLKPAVFALVAFATFRLTKKYLLQEKELWLAMVAFLMALLHVSFTLIFLGSILTGFLWWRRHKPPGFYDQLGFKFTPRDVRDSVRVIVLVAISWLFPMVILSRLGLQYQWFRQLSMFFTGTALLSFGGAYTVLPYVWSGVTAQHWLSNNDMMNALALGETTPGPLIMIVAFVGFVATWNHIHTVDIHHGWLALIGGLIAVWYTFLPSFSLPDFKYVFSALFAAVVGMMSLLVLRTLGSMVHAGHWQVNAIQLTLGVLAFLVLWKKPHIPVWAVVMACGLVGVVVS